MAPDEAGQRALLNGNVQPGDGNDADRMNEENAGPPKITPVELFRKQKRETTKKKEQKADAPAENGEANMEDIEDIPDHKFAATFEVPDVYSFDFKY